MRTAAPILAAIGLALAGVASAQPTAPTPAQPKAAPAPKAAPVAEEPPPANVTAPPPVVSQPVTPVPIVPLPDPKPAPRAKAAEAKPVEPLKRVRAGSAIVQALDKVTAETLRFEAAVGRPVRWKGLIFTVRACERSAPDEAIDDSVAYLSIDSQPRAQPGRATPPAREAFRGWMYASSPGLHPMGHATYDAWVISCRAASPARPAAPAR